MLHLFSIPLAFDPCLCMKSKGWVADIFVALGITGTPITIHALFCLRERRSFVDVSCDNRASVIDPVASCYFLFDAD